MAKACGFFVAIARDEYTAEFSAVCVWETEYDTRITRIVRGYDVETKQACSKEDMVRNPNQWVFATHPNGTHGSVLNTYGAPSASLAFAGYKRGVIS